METPQLSELVRKIDQTVFQQIENFKKQAAWQRLSELYNELSPEQLRNVKWGLYVAIIILPLFAIGIVYLQMSTIQKSLETRQKLITDIQHFLAENSQIGGLIQQLTSPTEFQSETILQNKIAASAQMLSLDLSKLEIQNFNINDVTDNLKEVEADIRFKGLATEQLVGLVTQLMTSEKMKVSSLDVQRDPQTQLIEGVIKTLFYNQVQMLGPEGEE
jgi:hypothetical protein